MVLVLAILGSLSAQRAAADSVTLGAFTFDSSLFGDTLGESDGGSFRSDSDSWLNVVNADPGNPGALTGANFDSGIANIGFTVVDPIYTIGYSSPIMNIAGGDLGIVVARFSTDDWQLAVSQDGVNFTAFQDILAEGAVSTGIGKAYFWNFSGSYGATLFVHSIDLTAFGVPLGGAISAVRISSSTEGDLIRVAGFEGAQRIIPEPGSTTLLGFGLLILGAARRWKRNA